MLDHIVLDDLDDDDDAQVAWGTVIEADIQGCRGM